MSEPRTPVRLLTRLFGAALLLLPRGLRQAHGDEMLDVFEARMRRARRGHGPGVGTVALRAFGDLAVEVVAARRPQKGRTTTEGGDTMGSWIRDVRHAFRAMRRAPRYALASILTFAIAVGATTGVYAAVHGLLLAPLPFPDPDGLIFVGQSGADEGDAHVVSRYVLDRVAEEVDALEHLATYNIWEATLTDRGDPARLSGAVVTDAYFRALGRAPALGRTFLPEDDVEGAPRRVVVSHRLWRDRLGSDPDAIGETLQLNGVSYEVIGVMPPGFETPDQYSFAGASRDRPDVWRTFRSPNTHMDPGNRSYRGVARLAAGATLSRAEAEAEALDRRLAEEHEAWRSGERVSLVPLQAHFARRSRSTLLLLLGAVGFVLLAACVNVMSLSLARGLDRADDLRVRVSLGARRIRLLRALTIEVLVLAGLGGALGVVLAALSLDAFLASVPAGVPRLSAVSVDPATVLVVGGVTLLAALLTGLIPAARLLWGGDTVPRPTTRSATAGAGQRRTLAAFSALQVALAVMLVTGAGLLLRSFSRLVAVDPGYDPTDVVVVQLDLPSARYEDRPTRLAAVRSILDGVTSDPMVRSAGMVTSVPQLGYNNFSFGLTVTSAATDSTARQWARYRGVTPGYLETMGIRVLTGRMIDERDWHLSDDDELTLTAVAVNAEFVDRWLPDGVDPLGAEVDLHGMAGAGTVGIVGVVESVRYDMLDVPPEPEIYLPVSGSFFTVFLAAKAQADPTALPGRLASVVHGVDPTIPVEALFQEELVAASTAKIRVTLQLMTALAGFVVLLSAVGLYGVIAHGVARRRREFGIRMAVGASAGDVMGSVVRGGARLVVWGVVVGLAAAWAASRALAAMLYEVERTDPLTFSSASTLVVLIAALAVWVPARRSTRVDPAEALRAE